MTDPIELLGSFASDILPVLALGLTGLWLAAAWWAYVDMSRRSESELARLGAVAWLLLSTPALLPLSLPVYLFARPQATAAERRSVRMVAALANEVLDERCQQCGELSDSEWRRCPTCAAWLQAACLDCGRWSGVELMTCPWCATERLPLGLDGAPIGVPVFEVPVLEPIPVAVGPGREMPESARRQMLPTRLVRQ